MSSVKNPPANAGDARVTGLLPGSGRSQSRKWQPIPIFLTVKLHGQRSLMGSQRVGHNCVTNTQDNSHIQPS